jgi:DNA (cytosine-5)-methyltransferase 1
MTGLTSLELCAGGGGTALGLEQAGFDHRLLVEIDHDACRTLRANRPGWLVAEADIAKVDGRLIAGQLDLLSAGLPCTPHSRGGRQLGEDDERHLWGEALRIIGEALPPAVMLETSDAIFRARFDAERAGTRERLRQLGYQTRWQYITASQFGVPQVRCRAVLVAFREDAAAEAFRWPEPSPDPPPTVGDVLYGLMTAQGWPGADAWRAGAPGPAPTVSGGSSLHGGPDLGPSQTKRAFRKLGIDPMGIADEAPGPDGKFSRGGGKIFDAGETGPMLTVAMAARLQGFPDGWVFTGRKTSAYRQVGNAFPPPTAGVIGEAIRNALEAARLWTSPSAPGRNRAISVPSLP